MSDSVIILHPRASLFPPTGILQPHTHNLPHRGERNVKVRATTKPHRSIPAKWRRDKLFLALLVLHEIDLLRSDATISVVLRDSTSNHL
jgi:hypothetical protein